MFSQVNHHFFTGQSIIFIGFNGDFPLWFTPFHPWILRFAASQDFQRAIEGAFVALERFEAAGDPNAQDGRDAGNAGCFPCFAFLNGQATGWWFGTCFIFPYILGLIIRIDVHIFQRGGPTTNQKQLVRCFSITVVMIVYLWNWVNQLVRYNLIFCYGKLY